MNNDANKSDDRKKKITGIFFAFTSFNLNI